MRPSPIAIDGPAASGKTTLGRALAERLGYLFLDTGAMYRAFTLAALDRGVEAADAAGCARLASELDLGVEVASGETRVLIDGEDVTARLRAPEVEATVSAYSAVPGVRAALVRLQREVAGRGPAILAGRDIGTVVLPDAPLKLFLMASHDARAERRSVQSQDWGPAQDAKQARRDIEARDRKDSTRAASPLEVAADALVIDTSELAIDEVIALAMDRIECAAS